jgi:3-deoxy-7-phosphoheptulonate synthase
MTTMAAPATAHDVRTLPTPADLRRDRPVPSSVTDQVTAGRREIAGALHDVDARLVVTVGPCSLHDTTSALEYAAWLREVSPRFEARLHLLMRAYVEKPRTRLGWKGLVADPRLDGSGDMAEGLRVARDLMGGLAATGVGLATEFVTPTTAPYLIDLVTWVSVGARTVESPVHRELASWLPCPVGFKNTVSGDVGAAVNAIVAAATPQTVIGCSDDGRPAQRRSPGNLAAHLVLRGGPLPNYHVAGVAAAASRLSAEGLPPRLFVDCSHGNSGGDAGGQRAVVDELGRQIAGGSTAIAGVVIESHLRAGAQALVPGLPLVYGQSITDACLGLDDTEAALTVLYDAVGPSGRR